MMLIARSQFSFVRDQNTVTECHQPRLEGQTVRGTEQTREQIETRFLDDYQNFRVTGQSHLQVCVHVFVFQCVTLHLSLGFLVCILMCLCATCRLLFLLMCVLRVCGFVGSGTACTDRMPIWTCSHYPPLAWQ